MPPESVLTAAARPVGKPDLVENRGNAPAQVASPKPVEAAPEKQVVHAGELFVERDLLRNDPELSAQLRAAAPHRQPADARISTGGLDERGEHPDGRALARPVGAEKAEDLALPYVEAHAVDGRDAPVLLAQLFDFNECHFIPPDHGTNMPPGPQVPGSAESHGKVMIWGMACMSVFYWKRAK